jgi:hypothetical protein
MKYKEILHQLKLFIRSTCYLLIAHYIQQGSTDIAIPPPPVHQSDKILHVTVFCFLDYNCARNIIALNRGTCSHLPKTMYKTLHLTVRSVYARYSLLFRFIFTFVKKSDMGAGENIDEQIETLELRHPCCASTN